jgi:hypothetical protein
MARNWHFSRWRFAGMQVVMWVVLCGALGLAALETNSAHRALLASMGRPIVEGTLTFRFPADWHVVSERADQALIYQAEEQSGDADRKLTIVYQRVDHLMPPVQYLERNLLLPRTSGEMDRQWIALNGWPGQMLRWQMMKTAPTGDGENLSTICVCAVLPTYKAIMLRLDKLGDVTPEDMDLVTGMLKGMSISDLPAAADNAIDLGAARISVPTDFIVYPQTDALRKDRTIVRQTAGGGWISVDLVPVEMSGNLPTAWWLNGALASREQFDPHDPLPSLSWLDANLVKETDNRWRIEPADSADSPVRRRAYLVTGPANQGLEIILTAQSPASEAEIDQAMGDLSGKIQFGTAADLNTLLAQGALALSAAPDASSELAGEFWWLWSRAEAVEGWTRGSSPTTGQLPVRDTVKVDLQSNVVSTLQRWSLSDSPAGVWAQLTRLDGQQQATFTSNTRLSDNIVSTLTVGPDAQKTTTMPLTPGFVSSAHLPRLLPVISQKPVAVWTDSFPGGEADPLPSPVLLLVHTISSDDSTRCVEAEINGTGKISRWYFRADGTLDHADFAGGLNLRTAAQSDIQSAIQSDRRLTLP